MRLVLCAFVCVIALTACSGKDNPRVLRGYAQGTTYNIQFYPGDAVIDLDQLGGRVAAELESIDAAMSGYLPNSMIERFNRAGTTESQSVGTEIVRLVEIASQISRDSDGCYDLTVKPLFALWGFSDDAFTVPDPLELKTVMARVGMGKLEIAGPAELRKRLPDVEIDLSSIAQGYSAARLAQVLIQSGVQDYMVEIGGEVIVSGSKPRGQPWRIAIERPLPGVRRVEKIISTEGPNPLAIATSGTYRHYFDDQGARYSHILDVRTGFPVNHTTVSVTVIHGDASYADAWSTALLCLGTEAGVMLADRRGIAALFIQQDDSGLTETQSKPLQDNDNITIE